MNIRVHRFLLGVSFLALLGACSNIQLSPAGDKVRVLAQQEVGKCRYIGKVTSTVTDRVGVIARDEEVVRKEVEANARNSAGDMGGDTIVSASPLADGRQSFDVYRCINP